MIASVLRRGNRHARRIGSDLRMHITVNGEGHEIPDALDVAALLRHLGCGERRVAVEVNRAIVPRSAHATHRLAEGDQVELVQAMGGG
jgi:sulfur carrier protein